MPTGSNVSRGRLRHALPAAALWALAFAASAQPGPGPGAGPPAAGLIKGELPPGSPVPDPPLTPAQQKVKDAGPSPTGLRGPPSRLAPTAPMPPADPRDFQGAWSHNQPLEFRMYRDMYGELLPYTDAGADVLVRRLKATRAGTPYMNQSTICRPPGPEWQRVIGGDFSIFQTKDWIEFIFHEYHGRWKIALNEAAMPRPKIKEYMGYSVGHWDGATLVVETSGFKEALWMDVEGTPLSSGGKLIERIRKVNNGDRRPYIEVVTTVDDPLYYTHPWSVVRTFGWNPIGAKFMEYNCEEQVGDPSVSPDAGFLKEPAE